MPSPAIACRTCASHNTVSRGRLPDVDAFAGAQLGSALHGGDLMACRDCGFVFRSPALSDDEYLALYAQARADVWGQHPDREDFRRVRSAVPDAPADVLDVGCYTGQLLTMLPAACRLHGVEPSPDAAAVATSRGVAVVAQQWHELESSARCYDVIIACDVIEHVTNPLDFLRTLSAQLKPAGRLIITTGNADAWPWRLARARFWYCYFPEHISFIGPRWLSRMSASAGLHVARLEPFSHSPLPGAVARARSLLVTCLYMATSFLAPAPWQRAGRHEKRLRLLGSNIADDHIFCVLHKA